MIYLHKILPIFLLPTGLVLILLMAGLWWRKRSLMISAVVILWLASMPLVSDELMRWVESPYQHVMPQEVSRADAIVVLSGGRVVAPGDAAFSEWADADRFFAGVELFQAGKAPWLVFTGGWVPWEPKAKPEGEVLQTHAQRWGVPAHQILISGLAQNTAQEAQAVLQTLKDKTALNPSRLQILLVTSAFHMQRAQRLFEQAGFQVQPYAVDFQVSRAGELSVLDFLPSAQAMRQTELAIRELYGRAYYTLMVH